MVKDKIMMWVHPEYKKKIKSEAARLNLTILDYTEKESKGIVTSKKKAFDFNFRI